jgi:hypothetical protein
MAKASKDSTSSVEKMGPFGEVRSEEFGDYSVDFFSITQEADLAPMMKGLPDDRCQCHHWGYVLKGSITMTTADGQEVFEAGDAFYLAPGHSPVYAAGTEFIQFSPTDEREAMTATLRENAQKMMGGPAPH